MVALGNHCEIIGKSLSEIASPGWSNLSIQTNILKKSLSNLVIKEKMLNGNEQQIIPTIRNSTALANAIYALRDDVLMTSRQRIWGENFNIDCDGKFNIELNYDKPEGYEETDETISGGEINSLLSEMSGKNK